MEQLLAEMMVRHMRCEIDMLRDLAGQVIASRDVVRAAEELRAECANPAPDATMRRHLRNRLFAALDAREGKP